MPFKQRYVDDGNMMVKGGGIAVRDREELKRVN